MKIISSFSKNMKLVSRNWSYFVVLFLCPLLLILIASVVLNSGDVGNVNYGFETNSSFKERPEKRGPLPSLGENFRSGFPLPKRISCEDFLKGSRKAGFCISKETRGDIKVYLDDTQKVASSHVEKAILEKVVEKQNYALEETSEEINRKISAYVVSLNETDRELNKTYQELQNQEEMLENYSSKITRINRDFNKIYGPMKETLQKLKKYNQNTSEELEKEINNLKRDFTNINNELESLDSSLKSVLTDDQYSSIAEPHIESMRQDLSNVNKSISVIEKDYSSKVFSMTNSEITNLENNLDEINSTLGQLEKDIDISLKRTRESKRKIREFQNNIDDFRKELEDFSNVTSGKINSVSFVNTFKIPDDPILTKFPLLVSLIIIFTSLVLSNMFVIKKISENSYIREIFSPISNFKVLSSDYFINMFFVLVQAIVLYVFASVSFDLPSGFFSSFFLSIILVSSIMVFIGMGLGYLIKNKNLSILITVFVLMFSLIVSPVMVPPLIASPFVKFMMDLNPLFILKEILFGSFLMRDGLGSFGPHIATISVLLILSAGFLLFAKRMNKKKITK